MINDWLFFNSKYHARGDPNVQKTTLRSPGQTTASESLLTILSRAHALERILKKTRSLRKKNYSEKQGE